MPNKSAGRPKAVLCWSSGKDSALCLYRVMKSQEFEVVSLLTTVTEEVERVSMHGVREDLLEQQARAIGVALHKVPLPYPCPNSVYEERLHQAFQYWKDKGVTHVIFGDLYLEDIRKYREEKLVRGTLEPVFPLWHQDTKGLAKEMIEAGFQAILICVDTKRLPADFAGRTYDEKLLRDLPTPVDPCGENGEFHTFVFGGPIFKKPLSIATGDRVSKQGFEFLDVYSLLKSPGVRHEPRISVK